MPEPITDFGTMPDGRRVDCLTLRGGGLTARILTHGARVQDLRLDGVDHPLVLGADTLDPYLGEMGYFGAIVGRFANRIGGARFSIDGTDYTVDPNFRGRHTLHGGHDGMDQQLWTLAERTDHAATLTLDLADGHMGFPGALSVAVVISLDEGGALSFDMAATADRATPCTLAHHGYFALRDTTAAPGDATDMVLRIDAERYTPVDDDLIPAGPPRPVADTPFDFRTSRTIGRAGYDHNFCLSDGRVEMRAVARLEDPETGLALDIATTEPGLQLYDGAMIDDLPGLGGRRYGPHAGLALETQGWPDAPNRPDFPNAILRPGETYRHRVTYRFSRA